MTEEKKPETTEAANFDQKRFQERAAVPAKEFYMRTARHCAEKSMDPVLSDLRDHMLFLKHSLNTKGVARAGETEIREIQQGLNDLSNDMDESIRKADEFLGVLGDT